uniref:Reverse transcriptase domain-containing protein n=1 Tax=Tanacetum cinerariifolium TaxID=118510 RepID=A0A6L2MFL2_TANCI|nr:reverse transcriptase domain-containing protein [Tanacetum cinerariifolium]
MTDKYCPQGEIKKLKIDLWNLKVKGNDVPTYTDRFQKLTLICTKFVANKTEKIDKYIGGIPDSIYGSVKASKPKTLDGTIKLANDLMDQKLRTYAKRQTDNKRKADDSSRNNHGQQQHPSKRQNVSKVYNMGSGERKPYGGNFPKSFSNNNVANAQRDNRTIPEGNGSFECGAPGHFQRDCPKLKNKDRGNVNVQGWVYAVGNAEKKGNASWDSNSNVDTGTFLLNNHYVSILFDTGVDRSFRSISFSSLINIVPTSLENSYDVELADGKIVRVDTIIQGCTLNFLNHPFNIDFLPVELGKFDVIIGMDWLRRYHAVIVYEEKLVRIPYGNETLIFRGNESNNRRESRLTIISCSKDQEYMAKGCQIFLAQIFAKKEEDKSEGKQLKDVPIVQDFFEVFPKHLPGLLRIKVNGVTDDALRLYLFPHSLTHHATAWFDHFPRNSIDTFEQMAQMFLEKYFPPSMVTKLRNKITNFRQRPDESLFEAWERYKLSIDRCPNHNMLPVTQIDTLYNGLTLRHRDTINAAAGGTFMKRRLEECYDLIENMTAHHNDWDTSAQRTSQSSYSSFETCGGPHSYNDCPTTVGQTQNVYAAGAYQDEYRFIFGFETLPSNTITNPKEELKGITTQSGTAYQGPTIPTTSSSLPQVVERETDIETSILNSEPIVAPIIEPVVAPVSAPKPNTKPSIPYPSRLYDQKLCDKANDQKEKYFKIFQDLNFNISFADSLILMPKFYPSIKTLLANKDKLYELARTPLNEHCSTVLKKLQEKLWDPATWNKISLPQLTPTLMTPELADRSISRPIGVAEDVFIKVGKFHFSADFVVVDFDADPRVPLILERSFFKTGRALIDVFEGELTLRVGKEAITFNLDQTSRYLANYNDMTANRSDVIDMACEEYSQEVLGFSDVITSGNPTPYYDLIVSTSSPTLIPFGDNDFLLEQVDAFLALDDDATLPEVDHSYYDSKGDILLLEAFLNDDPSLPPPTQGNYLPQVRKELKICETKTNKSSIDEPFEVELKDLPPHLEYAFLEGDDKLPVIVAKDLSEEEKTALITVLKSHKQAIAWKLSDIKGIDLEFYTHKILMEDDFKPAVQHQRRVNPKIHDVLKKDVLKLLDAGLIYPISDSPWCMRTGRSYFPPTSTIPRRSRKQTTNVVEPEIRTIVEMADNRTMAQMLQAPIEGYEDAIVVCKTHKKNTVKFKFFQVFNHDKDDIPETKMPPRKRLCLSTLGSRYEVGESSTARPTGGRGIDYGFVSTLDAEARRRGIGEVGYGTSDTWVDPTETVPKIEPMIVGEKCSKMEIQVQVYLGKGWLALETKKRVTSGQNH